MLLMKLRTLREDPISPLLSGLKGTSQESGTIFGDQYRDIKELSLQTQLVGTFIGLTLGLDDACMVLCLSEKKE